MLELTEPLHFEDGQKLHVVLATWVSTFLDKYGASLGAPRELRYQPGNVFLVWRQFQKKRNEIYADLIK